MKTLRKITFIIVLATVAASTSGCFGEFALTRKVYTWNDNVASSRFVKTLVFYGLTIIPVYEVAGFADLIIFNLIEFWTGSNPIAMTEGEYEYQLVEHNGIQYKIEATHAQFNILKISQNEQEQLVSFQFNDDQILAVTKDSEVLVGTISQ